MGISALGAAWLANGPPKAQGGVIGPIVLDNSSREFPLAFPNCSYVQVRWVVTVGSDANFTIWQGASLFGSDCQAVSSPSNETCPPDSGVCSPYSAPPICFETGTDGNCSFTSTQPEYAADLFSAASPSIGPAPLGDLSVTFWAYYD